MRSESGLNILRMLNTKSQNIIITAADYMQVKPCLLEAKRQTLYKKFPVKNNWHDRYKVGLIDISNYLERTIAELENFEELFQNLSSN